MKHKPYVGYAAFMTVCITLLPVKPYFMTEFHILLLVISMLFHAVSISIAQPSITATITLHASGLLACQTLITVILPHSWLFSYYILNVFFFLLACFFFFKDGIIHFFRQDQQDTTSHYHILDLEAQLQELQQLR
ncbi:hypothetical protein VNO80_30053 [Phaseolus coccineus]|uniref:Uncharacterized protein n=1 Tax=Phaseolus coccineus TaxID=3886 RepID=A0AAN9QJ40_PHACN